jgi:hypothetical protein
MNGGTFRLMSMNAFGYHRASQRSSSRVSYIHIARHVTNIDNIILNSDQ